MKEISPSQNSLFHGMDEIPASFLPFFGHFSHGLGGSDLLAFPVLKPSSAAATTPGVKKIAVTAATAIANNVVPGSSSMASSVVPIRVIGPGLPGRQLQSYQYPPPIPYALPQPRNNPMRPIYPPVAGNVQQRATNHPPPIPTKTPQIVIPNLQNHRLF